eukprot:XP_011663695.1 PREDICTED: uncharacterized protein LOC752725 isoform X2 [Strongylocentrotus purpuratus]
MEANSNTSNIQCHGVRIPVNLVELLPAAGYKYHLCEIDELPGSSYSFNATLRVNVATEAQAVQWVDDFKGSSSCTWRVKTTYPCTGKYVVFKKAYICHHNTRPKPGANEKRKTPSKHTNCPTSFQVTVKNFKTANNQESRNKTDRHLPEFPAVVKFCYQHNHNVSCSDALKYRDVSRETTQKLRELFHRKYGPTAALEALKNQLQVEHGSNYYKVAADRAVCPDVQYCCRLYQKVLKENSVNASSASGENTTLTGLTDLADQYNATSGNMAVAVTDDHQVIAAICTPLMQRVHVLHQYSSELCFMDASTNLDRQDCKCYLLLTHSCVGGLPLGVLITTSETQSTISAALDLYKTILPAGCFGGRDAIGPQLFITDDCLAERQALNEAFPQSTLLLCSFHLLQATRRWLWSAANKIPLTERSNHLSHMRRMILAPSEEEADSFLASSMANPKLHKSFKDYLQRAYERKNEWACSYRAELPLISNVANNFCEAAVRVLRDKVLSKTKAFSIAQLADFVSNRLEDYYQRRILDVANGRFDSIPSSKSVVNACDGLTDQDITKISETEYKVVSPSESETEYHVNTHVGCCTCNIGRTGGPCKHQAAVVCFHSTPSLNYVPLLTDTNARLLLYRIATGREVAEEGWFAGLESVPVEELTVHSPNLVPEEMPETRNVNLTAAVDSLLSFNKRKAPHSQIVADVKSRLQSMGSKISDKLDLDPETFLPAVESMLEQFETIKTDSHLQSALHSFGMCTGICMALKKRQRRLLPAGLLPAGTSYVVVQPTATVNMSSSLLPAPKRKKAAPHSLSHCVSKNT